MGAAVGRGVAELLRVSRSAVPQLLSCGAGAGLAAAFNAPLAGLVFVIEELHREFSSLTLGGAIVSAVVATAVSEALLGQAPSFAIHGYPQLPVNALPLVLVLGMIGGVVGVVFNQAILRTQSLGFALERFVPRWLHPGLAAAIVVLLAWWMPDLPGGGHGTAERLLGGQMLTWSVGALALLMVGKFFATSISYASGAPGGVFAPMLLIGAITGSIFGRGVAHVFPSLSSGAQAFAVLGMAAMFVSSVRAPLTGVILIAELTANYEQLFALVVTAMAAFIVAEALGGHPLYEALLDADLRRKGLHSREHHDEPESVYLSVQTGSDIAGKAIRDAGFPAGCLVTSVERGGRTILPRATLVLMPGDHVRVLVPPEHPEKATELVRLCTGL
ncbi:MAG: ClC family H(+)/Cl(-) exchange transporter [Tepidisphaeraceae bacterium]